MEMDKSQISSDVLCEFLEVAVHAILYNRGLYPPGVFVKKKKYQVPVQVCVHPDVASYITSVLQGVQGFLGTGEVDQVTFVVLSPQHTPLERFILEISPPPSQGASSDKYLLELEQSLREFLLKLSVCDSLLKPLPEDCTWTLHVHTCDSAFNSVAEKEMAKGFPWVEADEKQQKLPDAKMMPLKALKSDLFKMQLLVEESENKV